MAETDKKNVVVDLIEDLGRREQQFEQVLPAHIPLERFMRIVVLAITREPKLALTERRSFFTECLKCATDGLLPDGREAALVPFNDKDRGHVTVYIPMIFGIRKKVRNSGEIADWNAEVVRANDAFDLEKGDNPHIMHKPLLRGARGPIIGAYSIAIFKEGAGLSREWMDIDQIEDVRKRSRAKDSGPWKTPDTEDYSEMCRKTVMRRHSKVLPMSTDLDDLIRRDDQLYDFASRGDGARRESPALGQRLTQIARSADGSSAQVSIPRRRGRPPANATPDDNEAPDSGGKSEQPHAEGEPVVDAAALAIYQAGMEAAKHGPVEFKKWWQRLNAQEFESVKAHRQELEAEAAKHHAS